MKYLDKALMSLAFAAALTFGAVQAQAQDFGQNFSIDQSCGGSGTCSEGTGLLTDIDHINFNYNAIVEQEASGAPLSGGDDVFFESGFLTPRSSCCSSC